MADPFAPAQDDTTPLETNPSQTLPSQPEVQGDRTHEPDDGGYDFFLRDGLTPYRCEQDGQDFEVFGSQSDCWMLQNQIDPNELWPSTPNEVAGMIGGADRLDEPAKGVRPYMGPYSDDDVDADALAEADSAADLPQPDPGADAGETTPELSPDMTEGAIRTAGVLIDVPFETGVPEWIAYKNSGQQTWTPPPGFRQGMPPIDPQLAERLGLPADLSELAPADGGEPSGDSQPND